MAENTEGAPVSPEDVGRLAERLEAFAGELPEHERNILNWIITRAQLAPEPDTSGYAAFQTTPNLAGFSSPLAVQLGLAAGFGGRAAGDIHVMWVHSQFGRQSPFGRNMNMGPGV